ncbi:kinase-like protein [Fomitiporia mediterranea MF3/22]|uniref:kinase-like protein n=1 Tax=Fomitiporia mediterranea (strain MF3/22) TaxID=694068 RepID=UPI00044083F6|nr:kinase-like protein [Fomitiporia mediterranea MF3/22]EJD07800.1 kinase-like protein [Fomitiporia mediterranea MF3/22]
MSRKVNTNQNITDQRQRYEKGRKISYGTFGEVYEGVDTQTYKSVALKIFKEQYSQAAKDQKVKKLASDTGVVNEKDAIPKEHTMLRAVSQSGRHENIISFLDEYEDPETKRIVFVFEYADLGDLWDYSKDRQKVGNPLSEDEVRWLVWYKFMNMCSIDAFTFLYRDILRGLYHLHKNNLFYRDMKPENILLSLITDPVKINDRSGFGMIAKIGDFGLSCRCKGKSVEFNAGTNVYRPPEAINGNVERKSDIWSLGLVMFDVLTINFHPFGPNERQSNPGYDNKTILFMEKYKNHLDDKLELKLKQYNNISQEGKDLIKRLLKEDPGSRINAHNALQHRWFRSLHSRSLHESFSNSLWQLQSRKNSGSSNNSATPSSVPKKPAAKNGNSNQDGDKKDSNRQNQVRQSTATPQEQQGSDHHKASKKENSPRASGPIQKAKE